jgi:hypothetical protein
MLSSAISKSIPDAEQPGLGGGLDAGGVTLVYAMCKQVVEKYKEGNIGSRRLYGISAVYWTQPRE